jgi:predicted membrane-bound spermidine synthase
MPRETESERSDAGLRGDDAVLVLAVFFASGFAGLVYEVMFAKSLALVFGSTATAATTVLATYMGGMSLGSWLGGKVATRTREPLRTYAACEAGIAISCALAPFAFGVLRAVYVALARGAEPGQPSLVALQVALGAALLLPPTLLMGATLPLLAKQLAAGSAGLGKTVGALYGANTLGAASGAIATGYVLLQTLGVLRTTILAVVLNLLVALAALRWARRAGPIVEPALGDVGDVERRPDVGVSYLGWAVLGVGGVVTLALEGVYTHLLAVVAGNSAFAFSAMLFCFLLGLGLGSSAGRAWLRRARSVALGLGLAQALVASSVLGGVFVWSRIPWLFATLGGHDLVAGFWAREGVRLLVCSITMVPPAFFVGASYPLAMEAIGRGVAAGDRVGVLGRAAAVNTLGNVLGALLGGFVLLPRLGSLHALQLLGGTSFLLAFVALAASDSRARAQLAIGVALAGVLLAVQPRTFDLTALASGANVYFRWQGWGDVIDHAESVDGGLTSVAVRQEPGGLVVKTLLTNGKFQGNDAAPGEVAAQISFALVPLLHEERRDRALVIGFGTGTTTRVVSDAGFASVDVADLSADIARLADRHFASVNDHVLQRPSVHLHVTDGRNFLMVEPRTYDLITLEISSIWFAGAASLYNTDFYRLARPRLTKGGVLQQWVQLHHLDRADYVAILSSMRSVFGKVWLYSVDNQGFLVACNDDCAPSARAVEQIESEPALESALAFLPGRTRDLLQSRVLTPDAVDAFLARETGAVATDPKRALFESTDDNLRLEYSTPRGNVRDYDDSLEANMKMFQAFAPASALAGTHLAEITSRTR